MLKHWQSFKMCMVKPRKTSFLFGMGYEKLGARICRYTQLSVGALGIINLKTLRSSLWPRHEGIQGSRDITPLIFNLGIRWRSVISSMPPAILRHFTPMYTSNMRLGGLQSKSGCFGKDDNLVSLLQIESGIMQPVAQAVRCDMMSHSYLLTAVGFPRGGSIPAVRTLASFQSFI